MYNEEKDRIGRNPVMNDTAEFAFVDEECTTDQTTLFPVEVDKSRSYYSVMANDFVKGETSSSLKVEKFIRLMVSQIVKYDSGFKTYTIPITDLAAFYNIKSANLYRDIEDLCVRLVSHSRRIKSGTGAKTKFKVFNIVAEANYEDGIVTFRFSDVAKPMFLGLQSLYTQYQLEEIQNFHSLYSLRLYELLRCDYGLYQDQDEMNYTVEYLREFFACADKYEKTTFLIKKVIDVAVKEINELTSLEVWYEVIRGEGRGGPIRSLTFYVRNHKSLQRKRQYLAYIAEKTPDQAAPSFSE